MSTPKGIVIGVEVDPVNIRAIAYDPAFVARGKARRSTKLARGTAAVIERMIQCVADAIDEGDLILADISAVGVAVPGHTDRSQNRVITAAALHWTDLPLEEILGARLDLPVRVENRIQLSARAVWLRDLRRLPGVVATLFLDATLDGAILRDGRLLDASEAIQFHRLMDEARTDWAHRIPPEWRNRGTRDWRKAVKRGEPAVGKFVEESLPDLGRLTARLMNEAIAEVIVIGGGWMEDWRASLLKTILNHAESHYRNRTALDRCVVASELGDNAVLIGAAALAQDGIC